MSAAILGSIAKATGIVNMEAVDAAIASMFGAGAAAKNTEAARIAFECTSAGGAL